MTDYISKTVLMQKIAKHPRVYVDAIDFSDLSDIIVKTPPADVREVVHGQWIKLYNGNYKCSECGDWWCSDCNDGVINEFNYCPNCGARMEE